MSTHVRPAGRHDRAPAVATLARALHDDPGWVHVAPDPRMRGRVLRAVLAAAVVDAGSHADVAERDGSVVGVAVWQPPGRWPMTAPRGIRILPHVLPTITHGAAGRRARRLGRAVDRAFPAEPVTYLQVIGVDPAAQRSGVGRALLTEGLRRADRDGVAVHLETSAPANVAYYASFGFRVIGDGEPMVPHGPVMWRMSRPRPPAAGGGARTG